MAWKNVQYENGKFRTNEGGGGGGGSTVIITPTLHSGTKIADFKIDGDSGELYAPNTSEFAKIIYKKTIAGNAYDDIPIQADHMYIVYFTHVSQALYGYRIVIYGGGSSSSNFAVVSSAGTNTSMIQISLIAENTMRITINNQWGRPITVVEL